MDHVVPLGAAMSRFTELTDAAYGEEPVPSCPGWTIRDLVEHLGTVHRWAGAILLSGQRLPKPAVVRMTEPLSEWYAATASALLSVMQAVGPDEPTPNFSLAHETAAFWARRQMHETTVHTVDAALALGLGVEGWPVDPALAADGVDEVLSVFFPRLTARGERPDVNGRVRLRATDTDDTWIIAEAGDAMRTPVQAFAGDTANADAEISGTAVQLYLALWKRIDADELTVDGDAGHALLAGPTST